MIRTLAVTGPTGAGKSRFCARLADHGATVIDADRLGHAVLDRPEVLPRLVAAFGADIVDATGRVDRAVLGPRVFATAADRDRLEEVVHPALAAACVGALQAAVEAGSPLVILEAAVYFRLPGPPPVQLTVTVTASEDLRLARLIGKGLSRERATARMAAQAHLEPLWRQADRIIDNSGDLAELLQAADALWRELTAPPARKG
jgi:dephospho-CoA kinase